MFFPTHLYTAWLIWKMSNSRMRKRVFKVSLNYNWEEATTISSMPHVLLTMWWGLCLCYLNLGVALCLLRSTVWQRWLLKLDRSTRLSFVLEISFQLCSFYFFLFHITLLEKVSFILVLELVLQLCNFPFHLLVSFYLVFELLLYWTEILIKFSLGVLMNIFIPQSI